MDPETKEKKVVTKGKAVSVRVQVGLCLSDPGRGQSCWNLMGKVIH